MKDIINFEDWEKLDLVVGEILQVEEIEGADKLYKLTIDLGDEKRTVCAGIKQHYSKEELEGKKIILIANLAPRKLRGIESQGMVLAACNEDELTPPVYTKEVRELLRSPDKSSAKISTKGKVILIEPDEDVKVGSRVS